MNIDHVVLWVKNPKDSLDFFVDVVGLRPVRAQDFREGKMDKQLVSLVSELIGGDSGGRPINHICLSMNAAKYSALTARLLARGVELTPESERSFGAQGLAERSMYFRDPDGNVIEIRHYDKVS
jgi:catechol 2,3-dioxygenase-like lactoylglutathione lyase family enzyme